MQINLMKQPTTNGSLLNIGSLKNCLKSTFKQGERFQIDLFEVTLTRLTFNIYVHVLEHVPLNVLI